MSVSKSAAEKMKEHRASQGRASRFNLEFSGDVDKKVSILERLKSVKHHLGTLTSGTNNTATLEYLLTFWERNNYCVSTTTPQNLSRADSLCYL